MKAGGGGTVDLGVNWSFADSHHPLEGRQANQSIAWPLNIVQQVTGYALWTQELSF